MKNAFDVVKDFEYELCKYTGAKYAVAVDSCTAALFLCFKYFHNQITPTYHEGKLLQPHVEVPRRTFISVPTMAIHAGFRIKWSDYFDGKWWNAPDPAYYLEIDYPDEAKKPYPRIWDNAINCREKVYSDTAHDDTSEGLPPPFVCLSFQYRKQIPIGRGGAILHSDAEADEWFRRARNFGRHEVPTAEEPGPACLGWHMYMEPERAARGLLYMMYARERDREVESIEIEYPDLSQYKVFEGHVVEP